MSPNRKNNKHFHSGGGEAHKMSGMEGERIGVNWVAWQSEFQHWL